MAAAAAGLVLPNAKHPSAPLGPSAPKTVSSKSARTSNRTVITGQIVFVLEPICAGFSSAKAAANWVRHERANEAREYRGESPLALPCLSSKCASFCDAPRSRDSLRTHASGPAGAV